MTARASALLNRSLRNIKLEDIAIGGDALNGTEKLTLKGLAGPITEGVAFGDEVWKIVFEGMKKENGVWDFLFQCLSPCEHHPCWCGVCCSFAVIPSLETALTAAGTLYIPSRRSRLRLLGPSPSGSSSKDSPSGYFSSEEQPSDLVLRQLQVCVCVCVPV